MQAAHLLCKHVVVPIALLALAIVEEAHTWRAVEWRPPTARPKDVDTLKLRGSRREAKATDLVLHCRGHLARPVSLFAYATYAIDDPLDQRVKKGFEDAFKKYKIDRT